MAAFLRSHVEEGEYGVGKTKVFELEQTLLSNSCGHGNYLQDPRLKRLWHTNVVEQAIHFWRKGLL